MKQRTFRVLAELALMACYVMAGWVLLTHFQTIARWQQRFRLGTSAIGREA